MVQDWTALQIERSGRVVTGLSSLDQAVTRGAILACRTLCTRWVEQSRDWRRIPPPKNRELLSTLVASMAGPVSMQFPATLQWRWIFVLLLRQSCSVWTLSSGDR